jgi:serine/threonine-protein kinase
MGSVYRALHVDLDREVALKVLPAEMGSNPTMVARFKREAKAAAQLQHENIVQIYDVSEDKGRHFLALEFVRGRDLGDLITHKKRLPLKVAIEFLKQAARALDHAYQRGIVHRDIKPSNFLITAQGKVKLCDLGLALRSDAGQEAKVTREGTTVGTVDYMAPEQARDSRLADTRSDIYALGCTFYHMLTGQAPFPEGSIPEKLFKHAQESPPDPLQFNPDIPSSVLYVLGRMLEKKPDDRYQTPQELLADLEGLRVERDTAHESVKTLAIGVEADEAATETLVLQRSSVQVRQREEQARRNVLIAVAGATAATVLLAALVIWLARKPRKADELATSSPVAPAASGQALPPGPSGAPKPNPASPTPPPGPTAGPPSSPGPDTKEPDEAKGSGAESPAGPPEEPATTGPIAEPPRATPRLTEEERKKLERELFPEWPRVKIAGEPILVARAAQHERGGVFASLEAACQIARAGGSKIQIEDNGPLLERSFLIQKATLDIRPRVNERSQYQFRPIVAFDTPADRAGARPYFIQVKNSTLYIEGVHFVVNADELAAVLGTRSFALFDVHGGDLSLKNCTFTIIGKRADVTLVQFSGPGEPDTTRVEERPARLELERCFARGEAITAVALANGFAEVRVMDCLFVGGQPGPVFDIRPPTDPVARPQRTLELVRSTFVTRGDFLAMDGSGGVETNFRIFDTIVACAATSGARKLVRTRSWAEADGALAMARLDERSSLYTGWDTLLASSLGGRLTAKSPDEWLKVWRLDASDAQVRPDVWPSEELGELQWVSPVSFVPNQIAADIPSKLGEACIGCLVEKLPPEPPMLLERTFAQIEPPRLLPLEHILPSFTMDQQKNRLLSTWRNQQNQRRSRQGQPKPGDELDPVLELQFDAGAGGDLGQFLAAQPLEQTTIVTVTGSGKQRMTPLRVTGRKSLVLRFQPTPHAREPLRLEPAAVPGGMVEALIDVRDGDLILDGATLAYPANAPPGTPARFIQVERGNLTLSNCRFYGPLGGDVGFEAIAFSGGPQRSKWPSAAALAAQPAAGQPVHLDFHPAPHERVSVCQLIDCYVGADARCINFTASQGVLRLSNCIAVTPGTVTAIELDPGAPKDFDVTVLLDHNTLAASKTFFDVGGWLAAVPPDRPLVFDSRDNLFCDPFDVAVGAAARSRTGTLMRYDNRTRTLQQGLLQWQSSHDGYSNELHSFLLHKDAPPNPPRQRFDQDWLAVWGRPHILQPLTDSSRGERIRLEGKTLKLREFKPERDLGLLAVQSQSEAAKKASDGGPIGVDVRKLGF